MKKEYTIKKAAGTVEFYTFTEKNNKGEKIVVEISECTNPGDKNSLPYLWYKGGFTKKFLNPIYALAHM